MEFNHVLEALFGIIGYFCVRLFNQISLDLRRLTNSIEQLNVKMAVIIEKTESHEHRISRLEKGE